MSQNVSSPFVTTAVREGSRKFEREYVSYKEVERVAPGFDPKKPDQFLIEKEVVEDQRIPIKEEINSHRNKVGLKNLLKGIVDRRQMEALIQKTQSNGGFIDATKLPDSHLEMEKLAGSLDKVWSSIPDDLKGDLTKEEFVKTITADKIKSYVKKEAAKKVVSGEEK